MRDIVWVGWCWERNILCITLYFNVYILFGSKSNKIMCENLALSCHWICSFHDFGFNVEGVLYHICGRVLILFVCCWGRKLYSIYYHHVSYYSQNHIFYFSCVKVKPVMQFPLSNFHQSCPINVANHNIFAELHNHD